MATISEDVAGHAADSHLHAALTVSVESMQLKFALNHSYRNQKSFWLSIISWFVSNRKLTRHVVAISGSTGTSTVDLWCKDVKFLTVLVSNDGASCSSSISSNCHSALEEKQISSDALAYF